MLCCALAGCSMNSRREQCTDGRQGGLAGGHTQRLADAGEKPRIGDLRARRSVSGRSCPMHVAATNSFEPISRRSRRRGGDRRCHVARGRPATDGGRSARPAPMRTCTSGSCRVEHGRHARRRRGRSSRSTSRGAARSRVHLGNRQAVDDDRGRRCRFSASPAEADSTTTLDRIRGRTRRPPPRPPRR